mmetsp:Transcript_71357/g.122642  ORF Transcript_71357/g.122642 Transcript_71357/m.122642 type:complete len:176 (+) Transcript_71357:2-529(+)
MIVTHLSKMATKMSSIGAPDLARQLAFSARETAFRCGNDVLKNRSCHYCASMYVPGETCRVRVVPLKRRRRKKSSSIDSEAGFESRNSVSIICSSCKKRTQLVGSEPMKKKQKKTIQTSTPPKPRVDSDKGAHPDSGFISLLQTQRKRKGKGKSIDSPKPFLESKSPLQKFLSTI